MACPSSAGEEASFFLPITLFALGAPPVYAARDFHTLLSHSPCSDSPPGTEVQVTVTTGQEGSLALHSLLAGALLCKSGQETWVPTSLSHRRS